MMTIEGIEHFLQLITQEQSLPTNYYMGWCEDTKEAIGYSGVLSDLTELTGNGYARVPLAAGSAKAEGTLTLDAIPLDGDTMTIDSVTYRFKDILVVADDIQIGQTSGSQIEDTQDNIEATINGTGSAGVEYHVGTTSPHTTVEAIGFSGDVCVMRARTAGTAGNSIVTTETFTEDSGETLEFDAATLGTYRVGGSDITSAAGGVNGWSLTTKDCTFTASGGNWNLAKTIFIATTIDDTGKLILVEDIYGTSGVTLADGQSYDSAINIVGQPKVD